MKKFNIGDLARVVGEACLHIGAKSDKSDTRVIINKPAVIVFRNGKKCVAKAQDEEFDAERGLMIALLRSFGIGYSDLQTMLKNAEIQVSELEKIDNAKKTLEAIFDRVNACVEQNESRKDEAKPKAMRGRPRKNTKKAK